MPGMLFMPQFTLISARRFRFLACTALVLLGACGKGAEPPAGKAAGAQVLPGTISDSMLNVDRTQSQPLLAPPPPPKGLAVDTASDDAADTAAPAPALPDAPATAN